MNIPYARPPEIEACPKCGPSEPCLDCTLLEEALEDFAATEMRRHEVFREIESLVRESKGLARDLEALTERIDHLVKRRASKLP